MCKYPPISNAEFPNILNLVTFDWKNPFKVFKIFFSLVEIRYGLF